MDKQSLTQRIASWMRGRNGSDELGIAAVGLSLLLLLINIFARTPWLSLLALVPSLYACWRISSRNIPARRKENRAFVRRLGPLAPGEGSPKERAAELREYKRLTCPNCQQRMRVPRGKGRMRVTCPSCHTKFEARS